VLFQDPLIHYEICEYNKARILKKAFDKEISIINSINDIILRQIKNCVKDSIDISEKYLKMILETIV